MANILIHLLAYVSFITLVVAVIARFHRINSMPVHLRWELYPVPHEGKRARHGGSYYEEVDWWDKPRKFSLLTELGYMVPEMLFLKALWENNRPLWYRSFPFHFGLYCLIGWIGLLALGALIQISGVNVMSGPGLAVETAIHYLTILAGGLGLLLAGIGAAALLHRRLTDEELLGYTSAAHIFNLALFLVALLVGAVAFVFVDQDFSIARAYIRNLLTFNISAPVGSRAVAIEFVLFSLLMAYVPLTHMSHFFTKYFFYHKVRWDDEPNLVGSKMEKQIAEQLGYPVTWAASHINADGKKTWADIATEETER